MNDLGFSAPTSAWFDAVFDAPTHAQSEGWKAIGSGSHTLIHAPTGSGKTLAAFLSAIDTLYSSPPPESANRCRVLYISPLKALAYDIDRNLRAPLTGIAAQARHDGVEPPELSVAMRTGDTPQSERQAMLRNPPDILITTPESLFLMLTSRAAAMLQSVETVIIDEVHAIAGTKRGTHLAVSLERLVETEWGTGSITASSCALISITLTPNGTFAALGYTTLSYDMERLTTPATPCPAP